VTSINSTRRYVAEAMRIIVEQHDAAVDGSW
jgi:hypothetical protein